MKPSEGRKPKVQERPQRALRHHHGRRDAPDLRDKTLSQPRQSFVARFMAACAVALCALLIAGCDPSEKSVRVDNAQPVAPKTITTATGIEMAQIPSGEFIMGDDRGDADEKPAHKVQVSAFFMDTRELTQKAYESLMEKNPSKSKGPDLPVEQVDWYHAVLYCNLRSLKEGLKPCYDAKTLACDFSADGYRLPTEAEWEYACRAGTLTKYSIGDVQSQCQPDDASGRAKDSQSLGPS